MVVVRYKVRGIRRKRKDFPAQLLNFPPRHLRNVWLGSTLKDNTLNYDLATFFASKIPDFYRSGIDQLPIRWTTVVDTNGKHFID